MENKKIYLVVIIVIMAVALLGAVFVLVKNKKAFTPVSVVEDTADIQVFSPKENEAISSPLDITGVVRGNGWAGFEGQVGTVHVLDNNGKELAATFLPATSEWTKLPVNFRARVEFTAVAGTPGFLVFKNENPSGDPKKEKTFVVAIKFK